MFDFQDKKNRYKMTVAALFTAAAMCVGGCGDAAAATSGADSLYQGLSQVNAALAQAAQADPSLAGLAASVSQLTDGPIVLDATGRKNGRGAYLCKSLDCLKKARKNRGLERSFQMSIPDEVYDSLEKEFGESETE